MRRGSIEFKWPEEGEVRMSGHALTGAGNGYTVQEDSCSICAGVLGVPWVAAFFEGRCAGCEVTLSGFPVNSSDG